MWYLMLFQVIRSAPQNDSVPKGFFFLFQAIFKKMWLFQLALLQRFILENKYQKMYSPKILAKVWTTLNEYG